MPVFVDTRRKDYIIRCKHQQINQNLLDCYNRILEKQNINGLIRLHKTCIHRTNLLGKNKYNTLKLLEHYKNTADKSLALATLTNALCNRGIFLMFLSDEGRSKKDIEIQKI